MKYLINPGWPENLDPSLLKSYYYKRTIISTVEGSEFTSYELRKPKFIVSGTRRNL